MILKNYCTGREGGCLLSGCCDSAQFRYSPALKAGLMALGINGEVISRAYALGPARGGRGLCAAACTPTWVFVQVHVSVQDAYMCALAVGGLRQQECLIGSQGPGEKQTPGQTNTLWYNQNSMCWHSSANSLATGGVSLLAQRQSWNNRTEREPKYTDILEVFFFFFTDFL